MKPKLNRPATLAAAHCYAAPLDLNHPDANMYGCLTCPVCKSIYRWPTQQGTVRCDDCGLVQELEKTEQHNDGGERPERITPGAHEKGNCERSL